MIRSNSIRGITLYADDSNQPGRNALEAGELYENHVMLELMKWLPSATAFLDIGCNVGIHTALACAIKPGIPIYAFDAQPTNISLLRRTLDENSLHNVHLYGFPLAARSGPLWYNSDPSNVCCKSEPGDEYINQTYAIALDDLALPPVQLVKLDVEGFEYEVLKGATRLLASRPRIIFEYFPKAIRLCATSATDLLTFLTDQGFSLRVLNYRPNIELAFRNPQTCHEYIQSLGLEICDIIAEPLSASVHVG